MMTRIRPILSWQAVRTATASTPLEYIEAVYPKPVSHYLYGGGGSAYYSPDLDTPGLTLERLWDSGCMALDNFKKSYPENTEKCWQLYNSYLCSAYGIRRIAYEGGPAPISLDQRVAEGFGQRCGDGRCLDRPTDRRGGDRTPACLGRMGR